MCYQFMSNIFWVVIFEGSMDIKEKFKNGWWACFLFHFPKNNNQDDLIVITLSLLCAVSVTFVLLDD